MTRAASCLGWGIVLLSLAATSSAAETSELKTLMTQRGKLVFSDELTQAPAEPWRVAKGSWTAADGCIVVKELKADMHGAVARRGVMQANLVVQYSFKLDGARNTTLSINDAKGHCCRVMIDPTGLTVRKDSHDHNQTDKPLTLDRQPGPIAAGQWHTLLVEILGPEMLACIDGKLIAFGAHQSINIVKKDIGLTEAGESVAFKDLKIWEATPNASWKSAKAALLKNRPKAAGAGE